MKLATTPLRRTIVIRKLNHITINHFQSPQASVLPDKWRFNISQDWKIPEDDFDNVSSDTIPNNTFRALNFHLSLLSYLEEKASRFVDVTDNPHLTIKQVNNGHPITDSKDEKVRKQNERVAKRKA